MSEMEPITDQAAPEGAPSGAYISARHRQDAVMKPVKSAGDYTVAGICAIIALVVYAVLLFLLYSDYTALSVA